MAFSPTFLSLAEVMEIHQDQVTNYGGDKGIRDLETLKSAIGMPATTFGGEFLHPDICTMAAACLFHICRNHPFLDGNKRTETATALVFLYLNGYELKAPQDDLYETVMRVASGKLDKDEVTASLRKWAKVP